MGRTSLRNALVQSLVAASLALTAGCAQDSGDSANPDQAQSLRDVDIPEDFTFATSRALALTVSATQESVGAEVAALEVARADGRVLYRGPLSVSQPLSLDLAIPTKDDKVLLKLSANGQEQTAEVAVDGEGVEHAF